jgi:hypothetical protein
VRHRYLHPARTWSQYAHTGEREAGRESTRLPEGNPAQPHRPLPSNTSHLHTPSPHVSSSHPTLDEEERGHRSGFSSCFKPVYKGPGPYLHQTAAGVPSRGPASAHQSVSPRSPLLHRKSQLGAHAAGILRLDGRKRLSTAHTSPPPPRHPSRLPSYTSYPSASAAKDARVERLRGPRDAGAAQRGHDGCLTA